MTTFVNKLNEQKVDNFLNDMRIKYTKENAPNAVNVLKYTITSQDGNYKILFIVQEVLERFHELLLR